jgi:hypothetical protein
LLAASYGPLDLLKVLLEKFPERSKGEVLAYAVCCGRPECSSVLAGATFEWSKMVVEQLEFLDDVGLRKVAEWFRRSGDGAGCALQCEASMWWGVRAMIVKGAPLEVVLL